MTANALSFSIDPVNKRVFVNNVWYPLAATSLASNISFVRYNSENLGSIIYNDRPPLPAAFSDPSPYQSYVNAWLTAAAAASPALTLAQAQSVKAGLIDSIFFVKSQAPISVVTSLGTYNFDVTPNDPGSVVNLLPAIAGIISQFSAMDTAISNAVAAIISSVNGTVVAGTDSELSIAAADVSSIVSGINAVVSQLNTFEIDNGGSASYSPVSVSGFGGGVGNASASFTAPTALPSLTSLVKMLPIGSTSYPAFTLAESVRRTGRGATQLANETAVRATKQAALAALSTMSTVIAYDATTGW